MRTHATSAARPGLRRRAVRAGLDGPRRAGGQALYGLGQGALGPGQLDPDDQGLVRGRQGAHPQPAEPGGVEPGVPSRGRSPAADDWAAWSRAITASASATPTTARPRAACSCSGASATCCRASRRAESGHAPAASAAARACAARRPRRGAPPAIVLRGPPSCLAVLLGPLGRTSAPGHVGAEVRHGSRVLRNTFRAAREGVAGIDAHSRRQSGHPSGVSRDGYETHALHAPTRTKGDDGARPNRRQPRGQDPGAAAKRASRRCMSANPMRSVKPENDSAPSSCGVPF